MSFQENKKVALQFFKSLDWSEHKDLAHKIFHPNYPNDNYAIERSKLNLRELKKGPEGWLERNASVLPDHEVINVFGDETTIIAEYYVHIYPGNDFLSDLPDDFEPFRVLGYHTFEFEDGKIIGIRYAWDLEIIRAKFPNWGSDDTNRLNRYLEMVRALHQY